TVANATALRKGRNNQKPVTSAPTSTVRRHIALAIEADFGPSEPGWRVSTCNRPPHRTRGHELCRLVGCRAPCAGVTTYCAYNVYPKIRRSFGAGTEYRLVLSSTNI